MCWIRNVLTFWQEFSRENAPAWMDSVSKGLGADGVFFSAIVRWWMNWVLQENNVVTGDVLLRVGVLKCFACAPLYCLNISNTGFGLHQTLKFQVKIVTVWSWIERMFRTDVLIHLKKEIRLGKSV